MSEGSPAENPYESPQTIDPAPQATGEAVLPDDRMWAMFAHLAGLLGYVAVAVGQIVIPLVIYVIYKDKSKFVAFHALQSLFLQIAILVINAVVWGIAAVTCGLGVIVAIPVSIVVVIIDIVLVILASIKSYNGEWYEYPLVGRYARQQVGI